MNLFTKPQLILKEYPDGHIDTKVIEDGIDIEYFGPGNDIQAMALEMYKWFVKFYPKRDHKYRLIVMSDNVVKFTMIVDTDGTSVVQAAK